MISLSSPCMGHGEQLVEFDCVPSIMLKGSLKIDFQSTLSSGRTLGELWLRRSWRSFDRLECVTSCISVSTCMVPKSR